MRWCPPVSVSCPRPARTLSHLCRTPRSPAGQSITGSASSTRRTRMQTCRYPPRAPRGDNSRCSSLSRWSPESPTPRITSSARRARSVQRAPAIAQNCDPPGMHGLPSKAKGSARRSCPPMRAMRCGPWRCASTARTSSDHDGRRGSPLSIFEARGVHPVAGASSGPIGGENYGRGSVVECRMRVLVLRSPTGPMAAEREPANGT